MARCKRHIAGSIQGGYPPLALFFFGTLMDLEVLAKVLARPVDPAELEPARLAGWRRVRARDRGYPLLLPEPGGRVDGLLLVSPSARDVARVRHFESGEYEPAPVTVERADGGQVAAEVFLALEPVLASDGEPWDLAAWAATEKAALLARCAGWMADFVEAEPG